MGNTINKHIRVDENHCNRIEKAAHKRGITPSRLMISAVFEAVEGREWLRTEAEIYLLRSAIFTSQVIVRDMENLPRSSHSDSFMVRRNIVPKRRVIWIPTLTVAVRRMDFDFFQQRDCL